MNLRNALLVASANDSKIPTFDNVVAMNENYVVRLFNNALLLSSDYGETYTKSISVSIVGDVRLVHIFRNGNVLICGRKKAYHTNFITIQESTVLNMDGTPWVASLENDNFTTITDTSYQSVSGTEILAWGCYNNDENVNTSTDAVAECFYTKDFGANIKVFFRSGVSTANGWSGVINCRHVHNVAQNPNDQTFWIQVGDEPRATMSHWIKATYNLTSDRWILDHIGSGDHFKSVQIVFRGEYIYYTKDIAGGGLMRVKITEVADTSKHVQILDIGTDAMQIVMGNSGGCLVVGSKFFSSGYDGRKVWYSTDLVTFNPITVQLPEYFNNMNTIFIRVSTPNSRGMVTSGMLTPYNQPFYQSSLTPSVWLDKVMEKNGYPDAFI